MTTPEGLTPRSKHTYADDAHPQTTTAPSPLDRIDGTHVRHLRQRLGINQTDAAATAGLSKPAYARIEDNDPDGANMLRLHGFLALAQLLGTSPTELLQHQRTKSADPHNGPSTVAAAQSSKTGASDAACTDAAGRVKHRAAPPDHTQEAATPPYAVDDPTHNNDHAALLGLLLASKKYLNRKALTGALRWTNRRFDDALATSRDRLQPTGLRIVCHNQKYRLTSDATAAIQEAADSLKARKQDENGITVHTARVIAKALAGKPVTGRATAALYENADYLIRIGAITLNGRQPQPTPALRYALGQDVTC